MMSSMADDFNIDTFMSDLDAVVFARAGKPVDKTERDPVEVELQRETEANFYRAQARDERTARKAGAK